MHKAGGNQVVRTFLELAELKTGGPIGAKTSIGIALRCTVSEISAVEVSSAVIGQLRRNGVDEFGL